MKKFNLITFAAIVIATIGLALLKFTSMIGHVVFAVIGLVVMVICLVKGKKDWKTPVLEIAFKVFYAIALITGIVMLVAHIGGVISIVHKLAWAVFAVLFIVNTIKKK